MSTQVTYSQRVKANINLVNTTLTNVGHEGRVKADASNLKQVYQGLVVNPMILNEYVRSLSNMIALQVLTDISFTSPLRRFVQAKGTPVGSDVQEIYTGLVREHTYSGNEGALEAFSSYVIPTLQAFHVPNRDVYYPITVNKERIREAFTSEEKLIAFHNEIYQNLYVSAERDEYLYMRNALNAYVMAGNTKTVVVGELDTREGKEFFAEKVFEYSERLKFLNRWNRYKLEMSTPTTRQVLILSASTSAKVKAGLVAWAMNKDELTMPDTVVIDTYTDDRIVGMLVDERVFKVFDDYNEMSAQPNAAGRSYNVFYHIKQIVSMSAFSNAVTFLKSDIEGIAKHIEFEHPLYLQTEQTLDYTAWLPEGVTYDNEEDSAAVEVTLVDNLSYASLSGTPTIENGKVSYTLKKGDNVVKGSTFSVEVKVTITVAETPTVYTGTQVIQIG